MSKIAHYLQEHLVGEVMTSSDARRYFSTDSSILSVTPALVVYPRNENDVRKAARFTWQLAERGRVIPITARGSGTDQTGASLGSGIIMAFPAHMNRILELDNKSGIVTVEPGINYGKLQQTLLTHGRWVPAFPASLEYSTFGGAVANNSSGDKSIKYADTRAYVQSLRVVLANGEVIETGPINKRELNKKLGLATFEGEIYRAIDTIYEEQADLIERTQLSVTKNNVGYDIIDVKRRDGTIDLTPLFVGSQGTLGIITEIVVATEVHNPETSLFMATFDTLDAVQKAVLEIRDLGELPSALEMVDSNLLDQVQALNPNQLKDVLPPPFPSFILFIEYDTDNDRIKKKTIKKALKLLDNLAISVQMETDPEAQQHLWKIRQASAAVLSYSDGNLRAVPIIEDSAVPPEKLQAYVAGIYELFKRHGLKPALWGHAGDGNLRVYPMLNLSQVGDRQKTFKIMDEYYRMVISLGGTISAERNDGRMRAPYVESVYGSEIYALFQKIKTIFDPYGTLNPGVKFGTSIDTLKTLIQPDYTLAHVYDHLPRS